MSTSKLVFTVGHSNRTADDFVAVLRYYHVERLVDVRTRPVSRFTHFRRDELGPLLAQAGIEYVWMGDTLGGLRPGGYAAWMRTPAFAQGLARLEALAAERRTAFMCAERDPQNCHRKYIAGILLDRQWTVRHLIDVGEDIPAEKPNVQLPLDFTEL